VLLMVADKQIYAAPLEPAAAKRRVRAYVPVPRVLAAAERVQIEAGAATHSNDSLVIAGLDQAIQPYLRGLPGGCPDQVRA
jgi:hypothetical protein